MTTKASFQVRRVQRLGNTSLVVTLPREWVKRMGIKPGDTLLVLDEGRGLRVLLPAPPQGGEPIKLDSAALGGPDLLPVGVSCLYVMGYDSFEVKLRSRDPRLLSALRIAAGRLLGLEVVDFGGESVRFNVLIDPSKMDLKASLKNLAFTIASGIRLLGRVVSEGLTEDVREEAKLLSQELYKYQVFVDKQMTRAASLGALEAPPDAKLPVSFAVSLLGQVGHIVMDTIEKLYYVGAPKMGGGLKNAIGRLEELIVASGPLLASPSIKKAREFKDKVASVKKMVDGELASAETPSNAILLTRIDDSLKLLNIVSDIAICAAIQDSIARGQKHGSNPLTSSPP